MTGGAMEDVKWHELVASGSDEGWKLVWEKVVEPESRSSRTSELMKRYSLTAGDLMGMLYNEMIGRGKISLYRAEGSFQGWLRRYVRGFVLNANPNAHGEISIDCAHPDADEGSQGMEIPVSDNGVYRNDVWTMTHRCFHDLWRQDPLRAYIHILKTRFHFSSDEVRDFLDVSSAANVDQIFSRSVKFMRSAWLEHEKNG
jgi:hypothetical protein